MAKKVNNNSPELTATLKLLALSALRGLSQKEQILLMHRAGFDRHRIAQLLKTTPLTVSVTVSQAKQEGKARKKVRKE